MISTILTYLSLAYSFNLAYEHTDWVLWDYKPNSIYAPTRSNYIGFNADLEVRAGKKDVYAFVGGYMYNNSMIVQLKPGGFNPKFDDYQFRAGAKYKCVEIGYQYHCIHPIMTYLISDDAVEYKREGWYSKVYFQVSGVLGGKK